MTSNMPAAEVDIDAALVRRLLEEQHPDLTGLELTEVASGWDNVIFRLGDELSVRVPRRTMAAGLIEVEQQWLPTFAAQLPLPVPVPIRIGLPGAGYPWRWSVCPWLPGQIAARAPALDLEQAAVDIGRFLEALHHDTPDDAPPSTYRGGALIEREPAFLDFLGRITTHDAERAKALWADAVAVPQWDRPRVWVHGDMHPANILVEGGRVSAVIDFGDLNAGDPAVDLAVAWMLFSGPSRATFRAAVGSVDDDTWRRAHGWALYLGTAFLANSADNPLFTRLGSRVLTEALADPT